MTEIIIPIKHLSNAKGRLASQLDPTIRSGLVLAMLEDLLTTIVSIGNRNVSIVTSDSRVVNVARRFGFSWIPEAGMQGYNAAAALGIASIPRENDIAILPGDIPLAGEDEIARLIAPSDRNGNAVRIVPSHDRQGTNGLFMSRNARISPEFGAGSFVGHCRCARAAGVEPTIIDAPQMAHDIDTPDDLSDFSALGHNGSTSQYLHRIRFAGNGNQYDRGAA